MGEDMTYTETELTRLEWQSRAESATATAENLRRDRDAVMAANVSLNKRVRDLEAKLNAAVLGQQELERENAELRAKVEAVGGYVHYLHNWRAGDGVVLSFDDWYVELQVWRASQGVKRG